MELERDFLLETMKKKKRVSAAYFGHSANEIENQQKALSNITLKSIYFTRLCLKGKKKAFQFTLPVAVHTSINIKSQI